MLELYYKFTALYNIASKKLNLHILPFVQYICFIILYIYGLCLHTIIHYTVKVEKLYYKF